MDKADLIKIIRQSPISHESGRSILIAIVEQTSLKNGFWAIQKNQITQATLGRLAGICPTTAHRHLKKLRSLHAISNRRWENRTWIVVNPMKISRLKI